MSYGRMKHHDVMEHLQTRAKSRGCGVGVGAELNNFGLVSETMLSETHTCLEDAFPVTQDDGELWGQKETAMNPDNAWQLTKDVHQRVCDNAKTIDHVKRIQTVLGSLEQEFVLENCNTVELTNPGGMLSQPSIETRQHDPRRRKVGSPKGKMSQKRKRK